MGQAVKLTVEFLQQNVPLLYRAFCLAAEQPGPRRLCCLGCSAARCVQSSDRGFGRSQRQCVPAGPVSIIN